MLRYMTGRLVQGLPVLLAIVVFSFLLLHTAPGDPAQLQAGLNTTPETVAEIRRQLALDQPLPVQFAHWFTGLLHGDLGTSYASQEPVAQLILDHAAPTIQLTALALILILAIGIPLGVLAALHTGGVPDRTVNGISLVGIAVPSFVIGLFCVLTFGWYFPNTMPYQGYVPITEDFVGGLTHAILPAMALAIAPIGVIARLTRYAMMETLRQPYVLAATALGVPRRTVIWTDALRNALIPVITVVGMVIGFLLSGTVVVESVFNISGLGDLLIGSFNQRDYPVTIGVVLVSAGAFFTVNLGADLLYGVVNPKIRAHYETTGG